jgi:hypothetical protein
MMSIRKFVGLSNGNEENLPNLVTARVNPFLTFDIF